MIVALTPRRVGVDAPTLGVAVDTITAAPAASASDPVTAEAASLTIHRALGARTGVRAGAAVRSIDIVTAIDEIVTGISVEGVVARSPGDHVVVAIGIDVALVVGVDMVAIDDVVAVAAPDGVPSAARLAETGLRLADRSP